MGPIWDHGAGSFLLWKRSQRNEASEGALVSTGAVELSVKRFGNAVRLE